ncbi:ryncolin-1-like [Saccostrea cucullata]|uniref:ryncolin-1-like n=1 Tax=Saccostrea cuccullata TaxID=36930 RepID=UPI002ED05743
MKRTPEVQGKDGVYTIYPDGRTEKRVFCEKTTEGGGWTVIQRRKYGITDFYRSWAEYKRGFGRAETDYWLGNEAIHSLTSLAAEELRIDLEDFSGSKAYARYSKFVIASEKDKYKLTVSGYSGNTGDGMKFHNGHVFATKDKDDKGNSAKTYRGGWWYHNGYYSNLNGPYRTSAMKTFVAIVWRTFRDKTALKSTRMMIRPTQ